jgi:hypothetical protein
MNLFAFFPACRQAYQIRVLSRLKGVIIKNGASKKETFAFADIKKTDTQKINYASNGGLPAMPEA